MSGPILIALVFGALISLGLYFVFFWPAREPPEEDEE